MKKAKALSVSIVIPVYNDEHHLKQCLTSISDQVVKPDEVIVVDNNSSDSSMSIAKAFSFVTIVKEKDQGVVFARTKGFNEAKSKIIARIDSDTILPRDWIKRVKHFYGDDKNLNKGLTGGCYFYNVRLRNLVGWFQTNIAFRFNKVLLGHYILFGSNMALPKKLWDEVKTKTHLSTEIHEDLDLAIQIHRAGHQIIFDSKLTVGIKMRRVRSDHGELWKNLMLWPETLKVNGLWTWIFGWLGAVVLWTLQPLALFNEWFATKILRKKSITEN
ncbi:MAG: glycosyltransferase family 2 protein [bacterium]|nr:glycosyltransferase family 2 protein [bacterium]